jgi:hypothetical protein
MDGCVVSSVMVSGDLIGYAAHYITQPHDTRHNTPIHNILLTAPQLSTSLTEGSRNTPQGWQYNAKTYISATINN